MLIFDLTQYEVYSFPILNKNVYYDHNADIIWCHKTSYMKHLPIDLYTSIAYQKTFYVLMSNEKTPGYRKYQCEVIETNIENKEIVFNFKKVDFNKNEIRKLKIKNLLGVL